MNRHLLRGISWCSLLCARLVLATAAKLACLRLGLLNAVSGMAFAGCSLSLCNQASGCARVLGHSLLVGLSCCTAWFIQECMADLLTGTCKDIRT